MGQPSDPSKPSAKSFECTKCGGTNHNPKYCRWKGRSDPRESRGASSHNRVGAITKKPKDGTRESEISEVLEDAMTTMHTVTISRSYVCLGPILTTKVNLEGIPVKASVDTGSTSTIVSLKFLVEALSKRNQTSPLLSGASVLSNGSSTLVHY